MPFQKVEYEFPEDGSVETTDIEVESSDAMEIDLSGKKTSLCLKVLTITAWN